MLLRIDWAGFHHQSRSLCMLSYSTVWALLCSALLFSSLKKREVPIVFQCGRFLLYFNASELYTFCDVWCLEMYCYYDIVVQCSQWNCTQRKVSCHATVLSRGSNFCPFCLLLVKKKPGSGHEKVHTMTPNQLCKYTFHDLCSAERELKPLRKKISFFMNNEFVWTLRKYRSGVKMNHSPQVFPLVHSRGLLSKNYLYFAFAVFSVWSLTVFLSLSFMCPWCYQSHCWLARSWSH